MNPNTIDSIIKQLIASHTTISTMESCTSGLIASLITDTEGASAKPASTSTPNSTSPPKSSKASMPALRHHRLPNNKPA